MASAMVARGDNRGQLLYGFGSQKRVARGLSKFSQFQDSRFKKDAGELQAETIVNTYENIKVYVPEREATHVGEKKEHVY